MDYPVYLRSFLHFFKFAPKRIIWLNFLTLIQGGAGSIGLLMLIPIAQLAGLDISQYTAGQGGIVDNLVAFVNRIGLGASLVRVLSFYAVLSFVFASLSYHRALMGAKLQQQYVRQMRSHLYRTLLEADWSYLANHRSFEYLHRIGAQVQTMNQSANQTIALMHKALTMSVYVILMLLVHWQFTIATICVGVIVGLIVLPVRFSVRDSAGRQLRGYQQIFALLVDHLRNIKIIKASARESQCIDVVDDLSRELENQQVRMTRAATIIAFANTIGMTLGFCCLLYVSVTYVKVPLADFVVLMLVMSRIMPQIAGLQQSVQGIIFSLPAFMDIEKTLIEAVRAKEIVAVSEVDNFSLRKGIDLVDISFSYPSRPNKLIFKNLTISIRANETVAITGASGIGKTTLADLFASLLRPTKGEMLVDGQALTNDHLLAWRRRVVYVTQDAYLFNDSILFNLQWMSPEADEQSMWDALGMAELANKIRGMPKQLKSNIGDNGVRLSGGERQRLALARALLMRPKVLILDEATSALDDDTEQKIHQVIEGLRGKITVIIIAHRKSTLRLADRIIDLASHVAT